MEAKNMVQKQDREENSLVENRRLFSRVDPPEVSEQQARVENNREEVKRLFPQADLPEDGEQQPREENVPQGGNQQTPVERSSCERKRLFTHIDPPKEPKKMFTRIDTPCEKDSQDLVEEKEDMSVALESSENQEFPKVKKIEQVLASGMEGSAIPKEAMGERDIVKASEGDKKAITEIAKPINVQANERGRNFELQLEKIVIKKYETYDGEKEDRFYQFAIIVGQNHFTASVNAEKVTEFKWIKSASYGTAYFCKGENSESFDVYMSRILLQSNPPTQIVYTSNGWKKRGTRYGYIYDQGTIGNVFSDASGDKKHIFEFEKENIGSTEIFGKALGMLQICSDKSITLPLFLFSHIGVLTTLFNQAGCPVKFILAVIGETNSRKTSLSLCMTKIFNRRKIQEPEVTFNSTEGGIEKSIGLHSDAVLVIDDLMPAAIQSKQNQLYAKAEKVIRIYGDHKGIERMTDFAKNPGAGYYPVRGIGVITGELFHAVQSSLCRCLVINVNKKSVDNKKLTFYQQEYRILNTHLYDFILFITENYEGSVDFIRNKVSEYRASSQFDLPRYSEMYAVLMTGAELFLSYAKSRQFLCDGGLMQLYGEWERIIRAAINRNEKELKKQDWGYAFAEVCAAIAENGTSHLPQHEEKNYGNEVFEDEKYLYLRLDTFLEKLKKTLDLWKMEYPEFSKQEVLNMMEKEGIIETMGKAEGKRSLKLPKAKINRQRFLYIKKAKIYSILSQSK